MMSYGALVYIRMYSLEFWLLNNLAISFYCGKSHVGRSPLQHTPHHHTYISMNTLTYNNV